MVSSEAEGRAEALQRIEACRTAQAEELDLGGLQLTVVDGELLAALCQLGWLRRLFLGPSAEVREEPELVWVGSGTNPRVCNTIRTLPDALFDALIRLEHLDLAFNRLRRLPASIAGLRALTSLNLRLNGLGIKGAQALKGLIALTSLDLFGNFIGARGAQALEGLSTLTSLNLQTNDITDEGAQALKGLTALTSLELADNAIGAGGVGALKGLTRLTNLDLSSNVIGNDGAQALDGLVNLTSLNLLGNKIGDEGAQALKSLSNLTRLNLSNNGIGARGVRALKDLTGLTSLDLAHNGIGAKGAQALKGLAALTNLKLTDNDIGADGAQALKGFGALSSLDLAHNAIGNEGAQALKGLATLTSLDLAHNGIGAEGAQALKDLAALTNLNLAYNDIGDEGMQALKRLTTLTSLDLANNGIGDRGAQALKDLSALTSLDLAHNGIGAKGAQALKGLSTLTSLGLMGNGIGDEGVQELRGLSALSYLSLKNNGIGDNAARALADLTALTSLNLSGNNIRDISPLVSLCNLHSINLSTCHLHHVVPAFWMLPSLREAILDEASLPGVPMEVLSNSEYDNCLDRLRAHLADLTGNDAAVSDVKLMILGNGRVGKTQICRRLRGESFDEATPSTHGIEVSSLPFGEQIFDAPVTLKIWDFGGQDIYHGTHALFLKSRAIFPLVWTPRSETEQSHKHGGFTFRNQPLAYWLAYVRTFGGARSPVLVIQSQCDRPEDERDPPLPPGALDGIGYKKLLYHSAKGSDGTHPRGHAALEETLLDAVRWMRESEGTVKIGAGRAAVKAALETKLAAGERLISHQNFLELCAEIERAGKGRISSPDLLLDYLHETGMVFYRQGLFEDQIILDQAWALDAVYAVFDRASQSFKKIERNRGRFRRSELAEWVWQTQGAPEQGLFLTFMQQCGICFIIQKAVHEKRIEAEYVAPDLLPARSDDETQKRLKLVWDEASLDTRAVLTFALLPPGLMRALIASIGSEAGLAAEYWRDGVCFYDEETASRALIEQRWTEGWAGEVHIATKHGQSGVLLQRLIQLVENDRISLGAKPSGKNITGVETKAEAREVPNAKTDEVPLRPAHEPSKVLEYYVSYARGDVMEGKEREAVVNRLCLEAEARGKLIIRDMTAINTGERISIFMDRIGKGAVNGRVCILLSEEYLTSPYCMYELFDVWRNCREEGDTFIARTRVFVLPSARIKTEEERARYVIFWQRKFNERNALVKDGGPFVLSNKGYEEFRLMSRFVSETANILQLVQDTLRPRSFDDYADHVFE